MAKKKKKRGVWEGIKKYLREVKAELKKVNWPSIKDLLSYTTVVLVTVLFVSVFIGLVDMVVSKLLAPLII